jgi:UV DNA damage repair endonuclease
MVINILKNKNKEDKIETIKKSNIQKSVIWCEKYKIPCNRFSEKINIFLPINKDVKEGIEFIDI